MHYLIQHKHGEYFHNTTVPHTILANVMKDFMFYCELFPEKVVRVVVVFSNGLQQEILRHYNRPEYEAMPVPVLELNEVLLQDYDKLLEDRHEKEV